MNRQDRLSALAGTARRRKRIGCVAVVALVLFGIGLWVGFSALIAWAVTAIWPSTPYWPVFWIAFVVILLFGGGAKASS